MSDHEVNRHIEMSNVPHGPPDRGGQAVNDPVCGMEVNPVTTVHTHEYGGQRYFFCSSQCLAKFRVEPSKYLVSAVEPSTVVTAPDNTGQPAVATDARYSCILKFVTKSQEPVRGVAWRSNL
ncbi:MAG: YHS domain-containing protein [Deltaproteobacteria bacterium]|nr:YHS domain-containing protein [Deltaproteobacteria bacterium]